MKIGIVYQNIPEIYCKVDHFISILKECFHNIEVFLFTDKVNTELNEVFYLFPDEYYHHQTILKTSLTERNIHKQILISKKLGRNICNEDLILKHISLLNWYGKKFTDLELDLVVVWNGFSHSFQTAAVEIAKNYHIPIIFLENGLLEGKIFYNTVGVNAQAVLFNREITNSKNIFDYLAERVSLTNCNSEKCDYMFFPLQRDIDSNILFNSPYIRNMHQILRFLSDIKESKLISQEILYRPHPKENKTHYTRNYVYPNLIRDSQHELNKLILGSKCVLTVNSTVGITSMLLNKEVVSLGNSLYSKSGVTIHANNFDELRNILISLDDRTYYSQAERELFIANLAINTHLSLEHNTLLNKQIDMLKKTIHRIMR